MKDTNTQTTAQLNLIAWLNEEITQTELLARQASLGIPEERVNIYINALNFFFRRSPTLKARKLEQMRWEIGQITDTDLIQAYIRLGLSKTEAEIQLNCLKTGESRM